MRSFFYWTTLHSRVQDVDLAFWSDCAFVSISVVLRLPPRCKMEKAKTEESIRASIAAGT